MKGKFVQWILGFSLVLGLITFLNSSFFSIRSYEVISDHFIDYQEYIPWSALIGKNIFHIDKAELETIALNHRQIKDVKIKRKLPGTLLYFVDGREPVAFYQLGEEFYLLDKEAFIIEQMHVKSNLPIPLIVSTKKEREFKSDNILEMSLEETMELLCAMDLSIYNQILKVEINEEGKVIYLEGNGKILIGDQVNYFELNKVLMNFFQEVQRNSWKIDYLDLRYSEKPVFKLLN